MSSCINSMQSSGCLLSHANRMLIADFMKSSVSLNFLVSISSVECVGIHVYHPESEKGLDHTESRNFFHNLCRAGDAAIAAGAGFVVLGSTTVIAERDELEKYLGIRVVDPGAAALRKAEVLIDKKCLEDEYVGKKEKKIRYGDVIRKKLGL